MSYQHRIQLSVRHTLLHQVPRRIGGSGSPLSGVCCRRSPRARPDALAGRARRRARPGALHCAAVAGARRDTGSLPAARAPVMLGTCEMLGCISGQYGWCMRRAAQASWVGVPWPVLAPAGCLALELHVFASTQRHSGACRCNGVRNACSFDNVQGCMWALAWWCVCGAAHQSGR